MGKVIYVTGAPATGKSTMCTALSAPGTGIESFCYSLRLRDYINRTRGEVLDEVGIRRESAGIVTSQDVDDVDDILCRQARVTHKSDSHLLIDSHPVTKEGYGFRVTPFSVDRLRALEIDTLICLYADPDVLVQRIRANPQGRPLPSAFELAMHIQLQASVVAQYAVLVGRPCYLIDSNVPREQLARQVGDLAGLSHDRYEIRGMAEVRNV